jgi:hypothetical protein
MSRLSSAEIAREEAIRGAARYRGRRTFVGNRRCPRRNDRRYRRDQVGRGGARRDIIDPAALRESIRSNWVSLSGFNRPGHNLTGVNLDTTHLISKRLQMLQEFIPGSTKVGVLRPQALSRLGVCRRSLFLRPYNPAKSEGVAVVGSFDPRALVPTLIFV